MGLVKVVMTLLVRDEADIVDINLAYHLARGVDEVIVTDHRSSDGTRERLEAWEERGVHVLHEDGEEVRQAQWVTRMARMAYDLGADWVLNDDADEFFWPERGDDLKAALRRVPHRFGALEVPRMNFVARPDDGRPFFERMTMREEESTDEIGRALRPKVVHKANVRAFVGPGSHAVRGSPRFWLTCRRPLVSVLHFPRRTYEQFRHKVEIGGAAPGYEHKTIADAHTALQYGRLEDRYREAETRTEGLVPDTRLRDFLGEKWEALLSTHGRHD
jgi:hypothetical protein